MELSKYCAIVLLIHIAHPKQSEAFSCSKSSICQKEMELMRVEEIKKGILSELGMTEPPQVNSSELISPEMREIYTDVLRNYDLADEDVPSSSVDREVMLVPALANSGKRKNIVEFEIVEPLENVIETKLSFFIREDMIISRVRELDVEVFFVKSDGNVGEKMATAKGELDGSNRIAVILNVDDVRRWYAMNSIQGLYVKATTVEDGGKHRELELQTEKMILQLTIKKATRKSKRSSQPICTEKSPKTGCCLYDLMVDFRAIGWDWIVAPPRYNTYMCKGQCKEVYNSHHTSPYSGYTKIMQAALRMGNETKRLMDMFGACCHPTEYDNVRLVYLNRHGRVSVAQVTGMIARKCACA